MPVKTHPVAEQDLMAYADGELPVKQAARVAAHLEGCPECQTVLAEVQSVSRRLQEWQVEGVGRRVSEAVWKQLELEDALVSKTAGRRTKSLQRIWSRPVAAAAAAATTLAVVLGIIYLNNVDRGAAMRPIPAYDRGAPSAQPMLRMTEPMSVMLSRSDAMGGQVSAPPAPSFSAAEQASPPSSGALVIRTAELVIIAQSGERARSDIERLVAARHGYIAQLEFNAPTGQPRSLNGSLRVPAALLDAFLAELKRLGHVQSEAQRGDDVTQRYVDTEARLSNLRITEQRLNDILRQRTGKLSDVLAVEEQVDRIRGEIERTLAEKNVMANQIAYADVQVKVLEEYRAPLVGGEGSALNSIRNAAVQGYRRVVDTALAVLLFLLSFGPVIAIIAAILFFPAWLLWRRAR
jgi:Domain of unknown function (DUF4349)/Putative zinc-finger